jgi:hypothetical protein
MANFQPKMIEIILEVIQDASKEEMQSPPKIPVHPST